MKAGRIVKEPVVRRKADRNALLALRDGDEVVRRVLVVAREGLLGRRYAVYLDRAEAGEAQIGIGRGRRVEGYEGVVGSDEPRAGVNQRERC